MKKVYLLVFLLMGGSCEQNDDVGATVNPYAAQISFFHTLLTEKMNEMASNPGFKVVKANHSLKAYRTSTGETVKLNVPLNSEQINLSNSFINQVWDLESTAEVHSIVDRYENLVAISSLSEEDKYELFTIGESVRVTAEFIDNGSTNLIYNYVVASLPPDEPLPTDSKGQGGNDPCIVIKDIMQGAVYAGFGNAIIGGYFGATAGTFTIPIAGTASGFVGGAVFGFAEGFFGAVIGGLGQQIIFDCMLKREVDIKLDPNKVPTAEDIARVGGIQIGEDLILNPIAE